MELEQATWPDVDDADAEVALVPVGSTEQHGPHAPLGTDTYTAAAVARRAAAAATGKVLVGPPIPVGVAEEHRHFAGTLWVSPGTFRRYVRETVESLLEDDLDRVVIVNGHGGNVDALREVASGVSRKRDDVFVAAFTWFDAVETEELGHAGAVETSIMLELHPDLVATDRLNRAAAEGTDHWGDYLHGVELAYDSAEFTANGTVGDPRAADATRGATVLAQARDALIDVIEAVRELDTNAPVRAQRDR